MLRLIALILLSGLLVGCSHIGVSAWNNKTGNGCPDEDYDNGGTVWRPVGFCKTGLGAFIFIERNL